MSNKNGNTGVLRSRWRKRGKKFLHQKINSGVHCNGIMCFSC